MPRPAKMDPEERNAIFEEIIRKNNGYLRIRDVERRGIARIYAYHYLAGTNMQHVAKGVFKLADVPTDKMYLVYCRDKKAVISFDSAAFLHGMLAVEPEIITVSVPHGYNAVHLSEKWINVISPLRKYLEIGKTKTKTRYGNPVYVYDPERTVCDFVKRKKEIDPEIYEEVIHSYLEKYKKSADLLEKYGSALNILDDLREEGLL